MKWKRLKEERLCSFSCSRSPTMMISTEVRTKGTVKSHQWNLHLRGLNLLTFCIWGDEKNGSGQETKSELEWKRGQTIMLRKKDIWGFYASYLLKTKGWSASRNSAHERSDNTWYMMRKSSGTKSHRRPALSEIVILISFNSFLPLLFVVWWVQMLKNRSLQLYQPDDIIMFLSERERKLTHFCSRSIEHHDE